MKRYILSRRARRDLQDIWRYTSVRWSMRRADDYLTTITSALDQLSRAPEASLAIAGFDRDYRRSLIGSYAIFYRVDAAGNILIVRVLHQSMDTERHLM